MFSTKHAQSLFHVASPQTIRNWTKEFARYLSPTATPGEGNARRFSVEDMHVLALIAQLSSEGKSFADIHASLGSGQRGSIPNVTPTEMDDLIAGEVERQLSTQLHEARELAKHLQAELETLKSHVQPMHDENIRLKTALEQTHGRLDEVGYQLKAAQEELRRLEREVGKSYHDGYMSGMKHKYTE
jgi:DNA-binding transcriptional MerR regulator